MGFLPPEAICCALLSLIVCEGTIVRALVWETVCSCRNECVGESKIIKSCCGLCTERVSRGRC